MRNRTSAIVLIVIGTIFLLKNLGVLGGSNFGQIWQMLATWWPLILIGVGVSLLLTRSKVKRQ